VATPLLPLLTRLARHIVRALGPSPDADEPGTPIVVVGRSPAAMWMRVTSAWLCAALYAWSLVAPVLRELARACLRAGAER
jgi:hypothetical protein